VSPNAVAVDAAGDIFAADYYSHAEIELQRSQPLAVNYPTPILVGEKSASQSVIMTNTGSGPLTISSIDVNGANASSFVFENTCGSRVAAGASCTIHGHIAPTTTGPLTASVVITDNAPGSPQTIGLSGTGVVPVVSLSATSLTYGLQGVGGKTASQSVILTNTGGGPLTISSIDVGGANASSFVFENTCSWSVAAGASCTIHGHFAPTTAGPLTATIVITDNAAGSPQTIALTGTGATPAVSLSATSLTYGPQAVGTKSASQSVSLTNTGDWALTIISIQVTGADASSFAFEDTCGSSLAVGSSCTIHGHFAPTGTGTLTAAVVITDNAGGSQSIALTGTDGIPVASLSATSLAYGSQTVGSKTASQSVNLTNTGNWPLTITSIQVTGADASSFVFENTCSSRLAVGSSCTIHGHFAPAGTGPLGATIVITDNAGDSPQSISLTGTGQ